MKELFIVRHAKSSWNQPELADIDRPLNKRGKKNAPQMGRRLANRNVLPDLLLSSPAKRSISTAKKIATEIGFSKSKIQTDTLFLHTSVDEIIHRLRLVSDDVNSLMIFGHNPGLTDLANFLTGGNIYNIPTCGVVALQFDIEHWEQIDAGKGKIVFFDYPKKNNQHF